jgi:hypothetical protein
MLDRLRRVHADSWDADDEVVALDLVDRIAGPAGLEVPNESLRRTDCPIAPELFGGSAW